MIGMALVLMLFVIGLNNDIGRIHSPIGLAIGAVSPAEIAVAIMGEITARLRQEPA